MKPWLIPSTLILGGCVAWAAFCQDKPRTKEEPCVIEVIKKAPARIWIDKKAKAAKGDYIELKAEGLPPGYGFHARGDCTDHIIYSVGKIPK